MSITNILSVHINHSEVFQIIYIKVILNHFIEMHMNNVFMISLKFPFKMINDGSLRVRILNFKDSLEVLLNLHK